MPDRFWVGGSGNWAAGNTANWSGVSPVIFTASCTGTVLTTTGSPALTVGNTVWSNTNVSLGTIVSGAGDTWVVSIGGTFASQTMYAATTGFSVPVAGEAAYFRAPTTYTVTLVGALVYYALVADAGTVTFAGTGTSTVTTGFFFDVPVTWNASGLVTFNSFSGAGIRADGTTFNCSMTANHGNGYSATFELFTNLTLGAANTFTLTQGTLTLGSRTLSTGIFTTAGSNQRDLNFGTGKILLTGSGTVWTSTATTNLITSGTNKLVEVTTSAGAVTVNSGSLTEAYAIDFTFLAGTGTITLGAGSKRNLSFAGYTGNVGSNNSQTIYGNVHFGSGTFTGGSTGVWSFASTSATPRTITSNGRTLTFPLNFNGVGGTWVLQDALLQSTTRTVTHTNGTLDINAQTLSIGDYVTATGTKDLTFNGGNLVCSNTSTPFNNAAPAGYTTSVGTTNPVDGKIRITAAATKTFAAATGVTYNCTLEIGNTGTLTITGGSTFNNITNSTQPATVRFTAGTTTTFNNFNLNGTAGNLITISSATAATHTLSKASGTVSCNYLSITNSIATGGASWYAGANSTNVSGNTGWIFTAPPIVNQTLLPSLVTNTNVFYLTTITQTGPPQTLLPDLYVNQNVFYAPTVTQTGGVQTLLPDLYVNQNTFYTPTVTVGAVDLAPALYVNQNVFYSATVAPGAVNLAPALYTNTNVFYSPTVSAGDILTPELFVNQNTFYPIQLVYPQIVYPDLFVNANTFYITFCYLYPFHPNDVRPGSPSAASGPRQAMPQAPNAARQNIPLSSSGRQAMPQAPNAGRQNLPLSGSVRQPMPFE